MAGDRRSGRRGKAARARSTGEAPVAEVLASIPAIAFGIDPAGTIVFASRDAAWRLGRSPESLRGSAFSWLFSDADSLAVEAALARAFTGTDPSPVVAARLQTSGAASIPLRLRFEALAIPGEPPMALAIREEPAPGESARRYSADAPGLPLDPLTALPEREALEVELAARLDDPALPDGSLAVLLVEVANLGDVLHAYGPETANAAVKEVADRVYAGVRGTDFVARAERAVFGVLLSGAGDHDGASRVAAALVETLDPPIDVAGHRIAIRPVIGGALFPADGFGPAELLRSAEVALRRAREAGRGYRFHSPRRSLVPGTTGGDDAARLRGAVEQGELRLAWQPVFELGSGSVASVEALVRWQVSPERTSLPGEFIGLAEDLDVIGPITDWVATEALRVAAALRESGHAVPVSINVSSVELHPERQLADRLRRLLARFQLPGDALGVEFPESAAAGDPVTTGKTLAALRDLGVRLTLDDFGAGFAPLTALLDRPLDELKLCPALAADLDDPRRQRVLRALLTIGHALQWTIVAKCVATDAQLAAVRDLGVRHAQGNALSAAVGEPAILELVAASRPRTPARTLSAPDPAPDGGDAQGNRDPSSPRLSMIDRLRDDRGSR